MVYLSLPQRLRLYRSTTGIMVGMTEIDLRKTVLSIPSSMQCSFVCTLASAFIEMFTAIPVLASNIRLEKEPLLDSLALRPISAHDDHINISGSLRSRDMDQAHFNDLMSLSNQESTTAAKRSANIYNHVGSLPGSKAGYSLSVSERSLLADLAKTGFSLVWDYMDITYSSYIAFYQTTELWANITADARGNWDAEQKVITLDISYGSLKLSIAGITDAISREPVAEIAAEMLVLSRIVVLGAFRLVVFATSAALVITLAIAEQALGTIKPYQLVTWP